MNVLILHASAGAGHRRAAEALAPAFESAGATVTIRDMLEFTSVLFRKTYAEGYLRIVSRIPELWGYMYSRSDRKAAKPWRKRVRTVFNKLNVARFFRFYDRLAPDVTVCTHFMPVEVLAARRKQRQRVSPFFCVVTDFAVHGLWLAEGVDAYYVATEEAVRQLERKGQPPDRIVLTGIPIAPQFRHSCQAADARRMLGLNPDLPTVLSLSGGFGVGPALKLVQAFAGADFPCQLLVVAVSNPALAARLERAAAAARCPIKVFGFVRNIHELMDAADIVISKPGGLTASEVMAKERPLVVVDPIPGQEQINCEYLLEAGAAVRLFEIEDAPYKIRSLLSDPARLAAMGAAARRVARPHAAEDIAADVLRRIA